MFGGDGGGGWRRREGRGRVQRVRELGARGVHDEVEEEPGEEGGELRGVQGAVEGEEGTQPVHQPRSLR